MAAKTVVCRQCGTSAAPGRYACAECGALLASVALTARSAAPEPEPAAEPEPASEPEPVAPEPEPAAMPVAVASLIDPVASAGTDVQQPGHAVPVPAHVVAEPVPAQAAAEDAPPAIPGTTRVATPKYAKLGRPRSAAPPPDLLPHAGVLVPFDEDAPIGSLNDVSAEAEPDVAHDLATSAPAPDAVAAGVGGPDSVAQPRPALASGAVPGWPPVGDRGVVDRPAPPTPAGSYLPPSAVSPQFAGAGGAAAMVGAASFGSSAVAPLAERDSTSLAERGSAALGGVLNGIRVPADATRRTIVIGSALASVGLLLPWINGLASESPLAGYLDRWGLAGPGMWLVLLGLVGLALVAGSSGRAAGWPIGLPAVAGAAFLGGLLWPYLVGGFSPSIGIWLVLVGAVVLAVGGILARRVRHAGPEPAVTTPDAEGR